MTIDQNSAAFEAAREAYDKLADDYERELCLPPALAAALEAWERAQWRPIAEARDIKAGRVLVAGRCGDDPPEAGLLTWWEGDYLDNEGVPFVNRDATHFFVIPPFPTPPTKGGE